MAPTPTIYYKVGGSDAFRKAETKLDLDDKRVQEIISDPLTTHWRHRSTQRIDLIYSHDVWGGPYYKLNYDGSGVGGSAETRQILCTPAPYDQWFVDQSYQITKFPLGKAQSLSGAWTFRVSILHANAPRGGLPYLGVRVYKRNTAGASTLLMDYKSVKSTSTFIYQNLSFTGTPSGSIAKTDRIELRFYGGFFPDIPT